MTADKPFSDLQKYNHHRRIHKRVLICWILYIQLLKEEVLLPFTLLEQEGSSYRFCLFQGGLKAVVWTDAFQMIVMVAGFVTVLIRGTILNGGAAKVWENAYEGSRLNIFE